MYLNSAYWLHFYIAGTYLFKYLKVKLFMFMGTNQILHCILPVQYGISQRRTRLGVMGNKNCSSFKQI